MRVAGCRGVGVAEWGGNQYAESSRDKKEVHFQVS